MRERLMRWKDAFRTLRFKKIIEEHQQLYTEWGEQLNTEHILEEYPRPQLKRDSYINLNGYWDYCFTEDSVMPEQYQGKILVPFSPESVLSEVNRQLRPDEVLWYERTLWFDTKYEGKRCILHFGAVDQYCEVFINYNKVMEHMGGYLPFSVDITEDIIEGYNVLTVKVIDYSELSYHSRGKQKLKRGGLFYTAQSGIWQTVWMEWVPEVYITNLRITPRVNQSAVELEIFRNKNEINTKEEVVIYTVKIYANKQLVQSYISSEAIFTVPLEAFQYWSPDNPFLYDLVVTVGEDRIESYFAMRKVEMKKDTEGIPRIFLNNRPYFQNGILDQGYWPDGLYTAPSDEALQFDIRKAKELGFNMIRKHIKIEPLRWYYHCDRLGMLVWQDMVNGGDEYNMLLVGYLPTFFPRFGSLIKDKHYRLLSRKDPEGRREWTKECIETVNLLYNCPSIIVWVPFNEGWGQFDAKIITKRIRERDHTRLIDHASGWFDHKSGDLKSIHNYFHKLKVVPDKRAVVFSEFGGYACYIKDHSYSWMVFGYRIYLTKEDFNKAFQTLYQDEIKKLIPKGLSAVVYTQITDVEDEVNGLLTYDRKVCKVAPVTDVLR